MFLVDTKSTIVLFFNILVLSLYKLIINKNIKIMKKLLLSLGLGIISFAGLSQVQLKINGACTEAGGYSDLTWTNQ